MRGGLDPKSGYDRYAHEYDSRSKYWDSFEKNTLMPYIEEAKGKTVLDAGAGTGRVTARLDAAGANVTALDVSPEMLAILSKKLPRIKTIEADMEEPLPFEDDSFDMIFSSMAIVHIKKTEPFLDECYRILKDDGKLILTNIHYRSPLFLYDEKGKYTIQCYNHFPRHLRKEAEELAFGVEDEIIVTEGDDVWVSQVLVLKK